ncbi:MAG TPA: FkbM family methyltransferase [Acetobacteraceae bacterium]|jgi:FkbM family methyltransferase|nr:FkbM family methyltransferase [Acetobacteraceae bacterium]
MQIVAPALMSPHINKVLQGEYDVAYTATAPIVVDVGANVGSFAVWALHRWPDSIVHCYAPVPSNFDLLRRNLAALEGTRVHLHNFAVGGPAKTVMFLDKNNCGEASFFDLGEQHTEQITLDTRAPDCLPKGRVLRLDTEGSEVDILSRTTAISFDIVLLEYHSDDKRREVGRLSHEYVLVGGAITRAHRGVLKYAQHRIM